jgi:serine/threonine protein kinase/WD40 repeat protein
MSAAPSEFDPVEELASSFLERYRRGERPSLSEYARLHPELADQIRELFPALIAVEELGSLGNLAGPRPKLDPSRDPVQLGEYRILREIGRGGMGIVYEAVQESLGRQVALKVLPFHGLMNPMHLERFRREARAVARLHHTNIVPVFGVGEHAAIHYYAMQFIHGQGLNEVLAEVKRLRMHKEPSPSPPSMAASVAESLLSGRFTFSSASRGRQPPVGSEQGADALRSPAFRQSNLSSQPEAQYFRQVAQIGVQVAEALEYAHGEGVLHRDIKPSNLLLDIHGRVWVTDFGLAKTDETEEMTDPGDIVGTLGYMAPERFQGHADVRSDVYGLGITLYELVTLQAAFFATQRARLIEKVTHEEPAQPRKLDAKIPRDLETIILKAIAKEPSRRFATARALAEDLRRFLADRPIQARRTSLRERAWRWCRRNPVIAALISSLAIMSLAVAIVSVAWALQLRRDRDQAQRLQGRAMDAERDAKEKLWQARLAQAQAGQRSGLAGQRFGSLATLAEAAELVRTLQPPDLETRFLTLRSEAIACLALVDLRVLSSWQAEKPWGFEVAFDAGLEHYAYSDGQGSILIRQVADHREVARLPSPGQLAQHLEVQFSPDSCWLAVKYWEVSVLKCVVWEWSARGAVRTLVLQPHEGILGFSPDSRFLAFCRPDNSIWLHDLSAGGRRCVSRRGSSAFWETRLAFRPDGRQLAFSVPLPDHPVIHILDLETGTEHASFSHDSRIDSLAWGDQGRLLAAGCGDEGKIYVWDVPRHRLQTVLKGHLGSVTTLAFNPAGDLLASSSIQDGATRLWNPVSGRHLVTAPGRCIRFSPDGRRLAFHDGRRIGVWEVADGKECRLLHPGRVGNRAPWNAGLEDLDFSPEGNLLASAEENGIRLWDATGTEIAYLRTGRHETVLFQPQVHPGETQLLTYGRNGLHDWPIRPDLDGPAGRLRIGPSRRFDIPANNQAFLRAAQSRDGRVIAVNDDAGKQVIVVRKEDPAERIVIRNCPRLWSLALSPDGRWVSAGVLGRGGGVRIWSAHSGRLVRSLPGSADEMVGGSVAFSPDSQWLVVGRQDAYRLWQTGSWEAGSVFLRDKPEPLIGFAAFSLDGRVLALARSRQHMQLIDLITCQEVATLTAPDVDFRDAGHLCFSPDGRRLAAITGRHEIRIWDLHALRWRLRQIGLDWEPPYPDPGGPPAGSPTSTVVFHRTMEAEELSIRDRKNCQCEIQDMQLWGRANWSNGHQLFVHGTQKGGYVELELPIPATDKYQLDVYFTQAPNYGVVETSVDDKHMGQLFDGFNPEVIRSGKWELGLMDLRQGDHRLRFTAVDRNHQATGFEMGIDYVELRPVNH